MRVLLVEDDELLGKGLASGLRQHGHAIDLLQRAGMVLPALEVESFDLVLLDLGLPDGDGLAVLKELRGLGEQTPVLILTARDGLGDRVQGLDLGADDYLVKPVEMDELCARARAIVRRSKGRAVSQLTVGELVLDPAGHQLAFRGEPVDLAGREFTILHVLMENSGRVVSKSQLEKAVYGWGEELGSNAVEVHIHHLRRKLSPGVIRTVRGVGYTLRTSS